MGLKKLQYNGNAYDLGLILDEIYPVGSIYMNVNNVSPATLFGGTWEQIKDTFLLCSGDTYTNGDTGGEAEHKLTIKEIPSHNHGLGYTNSVSGNRNSDWMRSGPYLSYTTVSAGGDQPHNNMPPYLVINVWKRTA